LYVLQKVIKVNTERVDIFPAKTKRPAITTGRPVEQFSPEVLFVMGANDRQLHEIGK
jgi:hypothetical protein